MSSKITVEKNLIIHYQNKKLDWIQVGDERNFQICHLKGVLRRIKGGRYKTPTLEVYFKNKPMYPISYFSSNSTRDLALQFAKTCSKNTHLYLGYSTFFAFSQLTKKQQYYIAQRYPFKTIISKKIHSIQKKLEVPLNVAIEVLCAIYNKSRGTSYKILPLHIRSWLIGDMFEYHNPLKLALDFRTFFSPPKSLFEGINPTDFWVIVIKTAYNEQTDFL